MDRRVQGRNPYSRVPISWGAVLCQCESGDGTPERISHDRFFLHIGNAVQHPALSGFLELLQTQKQGAPVALHKPVPFVSPYGSGPLPF